MIYKVKRAAKILKIHPNTLRALGNRGLIRVVRDYNGHRVFSLTDLKQIKETLFSPQ